MTRRLLVDSRDLFFRGKIQAVARATGVEVTRERPCDVAVVELGSTGATERIRDLVGSGVPVLAFGSHVSAEQLRSARALGAQAVPNSELESALRALLQA